MVLLEARSTLLARHSRNPRIGSLPAVLVVTMMAGCAELPGSLDSRDGVLAGEPVEFTTIERGADSGIEESGLQTHVLASSADWKKFWARHQQNQHPPAPAPIVDFNAHWVAALLLGTRPNGGHGVEIREVTFEHEQYRVGYATTAPGHDCITTQALTHPFHFVTVEARTDGAPKASFVNLGNHEAKC